MKAAVTRHLFPVLLRMIEIHLPPRDDTTAQVYLRLRCLCPCTSFCFVFNVFKFYSWSGEAIAAKARELYRKHFALHMSLARDWNYGDESSIVLANAVHVSVLPRAWMHMFLVWLDNTVVWLEKSLFCLFWRHFLSFSFIVFVFVGCSKSIFLGPQFRYDFS